MKREGQSGFELVLVYGFAIFAVLAVLGILGFYFFFGNDIGKSMFDSAQNKISEIVSSLMGGGEEARLSPDEFGTTDVLTAQGGGPLLQKTDIVYLGAFRVPASKSIGATYGFDYSVSGFAYYPADNSLLINNHIYEQKTAEISIPQPSNNMSNLNIASYIQPLTDITGGHLQEIGVGGVHLGNGAYMGGLMVYGDRLIGTSYGYYDACACGAVVSHFTSGLNFSQAGDFHGIYKVGTMNPGFVGGYMTKIPLEWQSALGGYALTGQATIAIIGRSSLGPSAFVFNPEDIGVIDPVPATPVVYYDSAHQTLGGYGGPANPEGYNSGAQIMGIIFPDGTKSILFFGTTGMGNQCYGVGTGNLSLDGTVVPGESPVIYCYDPENSNKGPHAYPLKYHVWAYDVNDFIKVKNGQANPWDIVPYATWEFEMPLSSGGYIQGVAYDPATQRIYISQRNTDSQVPGAGPYDGRPVIQVFQINNISLIPTDTYVIAASFGAGGIISPRGNTTVNSGSNQIFTITPNSDYRILNVTVDGLSVGAVLNYTFTNITANHTISVAFVATGFNNYTLITNFTNGVIVQNPNQAKYTSGIRVTLTAIPDVGYAFSSWSGDLTGSTNPVVVTMDANKSVTANFAVAQSSPAGGGGGSSGGGGGGGGSPACSENWSCGDWGMCTSGVEARSCEDRNKCGTETGKPVTQQNCEEEKSGGSQAEIEKPATSITSKLNVAIIIVISVIVLVSILVAVLISIQIRKRKKMSLEIEPEV